MWGCGVFIDILEWDELQEEEKRGRDEILLNVNLNSMLDDYRACLLYTSRFLFHI